MSDDNKEGAGVPESYEKYSAIREALRNDAEDIWFKAVPNLSPRQAFCRGFDAGYGHRAPPAVMPGAPSDAVRGLGRRLAELLDEDHWAECEPLLLGIETAPRALVAKWRHAAEHLGLEGLASLSDCADELEAALSQTMQPQAEHPNFETWWLMQIANAQNRRDGDDHLDLDDCDKSQYRAAFEAGARTSQAEPAAGEQAGAVAIINGEPATALSLLDALIDIYDDAENKAPEHRCYVEGAWEECLSEARALLAAPGVAIAAREQEPTQSSGWLPITTVPEDDREFLVGGFDEDGKFHQAVSHNENPAVNTERGWNHRNGPLDVWVRYWKPLDEPAREQDEHGRNAFARYIKDTEECAIVPDVAGAFHWAWTHAPSRDEAPATPQAESRVTTAMVEQQQQIAAEAESIGKNLGAIRGQLAAIPAAGFWQSMDPWLVEFIGRGAGLVKVLYNEPHDAINRTATGDWIQTAIEVFKKAHSNGAALTQPTTVQQATDAQIERVIAAHGTGGWQTTSDMHKFARAVLALKGMQPGERKDQE